MATAHANKKNNEYSYVARYGEAITRGGIASIPFALFHYQGELKLSPQQVWFISAILGRKWTSKLPRPSLKKMAEQSGVSEQQLHTYKRKLVEQGLLVVINRYDERGGQASNYYDFSPLLTKLVELLQRDNPEQEEEERIDGNGEDGNGPEDERGVGGLNASLAGGLKNDLAQGLNQGLAKEEEYKEEPFLTEEYLSNIRKAKSEDFDFGILHSTGDEPETSPPSTGQNRDNSKNGQPYKKTKAAALQTQGQTQIRNIEELEAIEKYRRSAAKLSGSSSPAQTEEPKRGGGLAHIGQTLQGRLPVAKPAVADTVAREAIEGYIRDIAAKLHDEAPLKSSTTRAFNLYKQAGVDLSSLFNLLYDAEKEANRRSATIKKLTSMGFKNRMAYFFAIVEDRLGLRQGAARTAAGSP